MTVYERIKEISKKRGMNLQTVAKRAGLSSNMIYQYKTVNPKIETLRVLADVLGVSVDYLLGDTDDMHANKKNPEKMDSIELSEALRKEGASLQFEGKEISDEYKKILLGILQNLK